MLNITKTQIGNVQIQLLMLAYFVYKMYLKNFSSCIVFAQVTLESDLKIIHRITCPCLSIPIPG